MVLLRPSDGSVFIGDAKATETPGSAETYEQRTHYAYWRTSWVRAGGSGVLALVVTRADAYGWLRVLRAFSVEPAGGVRVEGHLDPIDLDTVTPCGLRGPIHPLNCATAPIHTLKRNENSQNWLLLETLGHR